ncbi:MAG TPA: hypothetical protein VE422_36680 [Terriglobia bacterium]|nr:hypothetical protein [Terriglobia bacterium]
MDWKGFFILFEQGSIGTWVRESPSMLAFPTIIALHAVGMGLLAGSNAAMDFRIFGFARRVPISTLENLVPIMRFGFWLNAVSGVLLLLAYPTKALTNWIFYLKLALIAIAMVDTLLIRKHILQKPNVDATSVSARAKILAALSLACWAGAIVSGRLLAYTYIYLDASFTDY